MNSEKIKQLLEEALPDCTAIVESGDDVHFSATVMSSAFAGQSRVKQQQMVYAVLDAEIKSGAIHALSLKTATLED